MPPDIRWQQRFANFCQALEQLETFFQPPALNERERQGLIKAFEDCFELGWNTLRDLLLAPGLSHHDRLRLMAALDDLLLPWSIDLSLQHELPEPLRQHVTRVGQRLMP
jgi:hypothetical protein